MTLNELLADIYLRDLRILRMTLEDFSDSDMLVRPCPNANHAMWQLGHLIASEARMINGCRPDAIKAVPIGFAERYTKATASSDDPKGFDSKSRLFEIQDKIRAEAIEWVKNVTLQEMSLPGPEKMRDFLPTVGHVVNVIPSHASMHVGQFQVIRRFLGKPILF